MTMRTSRSRNTLRAFRAISVSALAIATVAPSTRVGPAAAAHIVENINQWGTGYTCGDGSICITKKRISACNGAGNICAFEVATGAASTWAAAKVGGVFDIGSDNFAPVSGTVKANGERAMNRTNYGRAACAFKNVNAGGSFNDLPFGGWAILSFTGVGSLFVMPEGNTCQTLLQTIEIDD